ncbi:hypothetical protein KAJ61_04910 [Candidatus Parcubacteria bacterium]|nr:hypothetical protein [Candidatus Parcubacteria bacterium]
MFLILTKSFLKKELKPLKKYYTVEDIKKTTKKISSSSIRLPRLGYKDGELMKLRLVSKIAGRIIIYVYKQKELIIPIVLRLKKDKTIGENLSLNNTKAKSLILDMLDKTMNDVENGDYKKEFFDS